MNRISLPLTLLFLSIHCGFGDPLAAQNPGLGTADFGQGQSNVPAGTLPANEVTNFKGTLKGMRRNLVVIEKEDGSEALVAMPDTISSFQFVAKATPAFLQRGMLMRFSANFGPGGVPLAPVGKITLFQPVDPRSLHGRTKEQFTPGIYSDAHRGNRNQPMVGKLSIVGRLIGLAPNGVLAVQAGKMPVQVPVDANTTLEVRYNNLVLAQEGDAVTVAGFYQPPNENQVKADRITITTDRVYGEYQPAGERKSRRRRGDKQDGDEKQAEAEQTKDPQPKETPPTGLGDDAEKADNSKSDDAQPDTEQEDS
ncbi:hypothetical protein Mal15_58940 [Stieleria maiorica]|uniref:DUF5666 domain-containing protein n=1 Tax=Stieleria maiorica TaxID=2795974 RepID=A0A5B9MKG5_9BACT|nr:hypothetical protein [Stieleria maiorica]QEG01813.1 hypothetical protein Mal15_58940 [Stieleria maiorica]